MLWVLFFAKRSHVWGSVEKEKEGPEEGVGVVVNHVTSNAKNISSSFLAESMMLSLPSNISQPYGLLFESLNFCECLPVSS